MPRTTKGCSCHLNYASICAIAADVFVYASAAIVNLSEESATLTSAGTNSPDSKNMVTHLHSPNATIQIVVCKPTDRSVLVLTFPETSCSYQQQVTRCLGGGFKHSGYDCVQWCQQGGSNSRPLVPKTSALPTALCRHMFGKHFLLPAGIFICCFDITKQHLKGRFVIFLHGFLLKNEYKNLILQPIRLFFSSKSIVPQRFTTQRLKTNTNSGVCLRILIKNCLIMYYGSIRKSCKRRLIEADTFSYELISRTKQVTPKYPLTIYYL